MKRVLAVGLDGAEPSLVERWMEDGSLPCLRSLRERGGYHRLRSPAGLMAEATPFCFYTGRNPGAHGAHGYAMWDPEGMTLKTPSADWLPLQPFWRSFGEDGPRAIVVDAPLVYPPQPFHGIEIVGWGTHDTLIPFTAYPSRIARWVRSGFGQSLMTDEHYGLQRKGVYLETRREMLEIARRFGDMVSSLMKKEPWDLFLAFLYSAHHGGHRLWNPRNISDPLNEAERAELSDALRQIYVACDEAIARLVHAAGPDTVIVVFSLHGMRENTSRNWILPEMLRRVLKEDPLESGSTKSPILRLRESMPAEIRYRIKRRLPFRLRRWLTRYWRVSGIHWSETRAFCLLSDTQGWIRINLKGRESRGIVEPGEAYEALCKEIQEGLQTFVDADTGKPVIKEIYRPHQVFRGENLGMLPDLILVWEDSPAAEHRAVVSSRLGRIPWPTPGRNPEGRSGNHKGEGVFFVAGDGIRPEDVKGPSILDLAPTLLALLGQPVPDRMEGKPILQDQPAKA